MKPSVGRIVHYRLNEADEDSIRSIRNVGPGTGNAVREGDVFPLVITRIWGDTEQSAVNGQVLLDGNDTLWVTSRVQSDGVGQWFAPPRVA